MVIDKPAGLLVHRTAIDRHETRFALQLLRDQLGQRVYPVHRLDKPTSGLLLFALDPAAARHLSGQFERQQVAKEYLAVVRGYCPEGGRIDHPLRDDPDDRDAAPKEVERPARAATTVYERLDTVELPHAVDRYPSSRYSLVRLWPLTGRKHQLRRHMKHISHPIIGDAKHGKGVHNRFFAKHYGCARLLLACTGLAFTHPDSGERMHCSAPAAAEFQSLAAAFGWRLPSPRYPEKPCDIV